MSKYKLTRREFLRLSAIGLGGLAFRSAPRWMFPADEFPAAERLGRICVGKVEVKAEPWIDSPTVAELYQDAVVPWLNETVASKLDMNVLNQRWVQIPEGYVYSPNIQPVRNLPNQPVASLPDSSIGPGMWAEVTIPFANFMLESSEPSSPWLKATDPYFWRAYYGQIFWIDQIRTTSYGEIQYRAVERYGTYGDMLWINAAAFKPLTPEDITPIHPDVKNKKIAVHLLQQTLSCYEGDSEVYFCRVSTGPKVTDEVGNPTGQWFTPVGQGHTIWRKLISQHMTSRYTENGYDTPAISWTTLFTVDGAAIHSTYWHNNFGTPRSHGCVNVLPEDAKWIFRWTEPEVSYDTGELTIQGMGKSTTVDVLID
jgi:hypothetical protein